MSLKSTNLDVNDSCFDIYELFDFFFFLYDGFHTQEWTPYWEMRMLNTDYCKNPATNILFISFKWVEITFIMASFTLLLIYMKTALLSENHHSKKCNALSASYVIMFIQLYVIYVARYTHLFPYTVHWIFKSL